MKRYLQGLLFAIAIASLYFFINLRVFNLDVLRITRVGLFNKFKVNDGINDNIILFNTGKLSNAEVIRKIRVLLDANPRAIGINTCGLGNAKSFEDAFKNYSEVVVGTCPGSGATQLSRLVEEGNTVRYFNVAPDLFEIKLAGDITELKNRGNDHEMINYQTPLSFLCL